MKKRLSLIISVIVIFGILVGVTLALFGKNVFSQNVSFNVDGITITYQAGDNITGVKLIPVTTLAKGLTDGTAIEKTITVSSTAKADFNLYLDVEILDNGLKKDYVKYQINKGNNIVGSGNFANTNAGDTITLLSNEEIKSRNFVYKLYIWIDGSVPNSMDVFEQNYKFVLRATASSKNQVKTNSILPDFILDSNAPLDSVNSTYVKGTYESYELSNEDKTTLKTFITSKGMSSERADQCIANEGSMSGCLDYYLGQYNQNNDPDIELIGINPTPGINFKLPSSDTNGKGLYIRSGTENNTNPIYYYRGAVDNNNVYFANFCWKIVRTTETGGLKMIYNGTPTNGTCGSGVESQENSTIGVSAFNTNSDDSKYVGYTYDNNGQETDSTIKGVIDTWYQTNILANYDNYIEDTVYCNDRSIADASSTSQIKNEWDYNEEDEIVFYNSVVRVMNTVPSLECSNNFDKYTKSNTIGNGKLTYPVGLLTMDETWFAGLGFDGLNGDWSMPISYYLNNETYWWTISSLSFESGYTSMWTSDTGSDDVSGSYVVRPVITLKPEYNSLPNGDGSVNDPYRFLETFPVENDNNGGG